MRKLILLVVILQLIGCSTEQIYSDADESINFNQYHSFAWYSRQIPQPADNGFDNQIMESNIKNITSAELKKRGMVVDIDSPDVLFDYQIMLQHKTEQQQIPISSHPYNYGYNNPYRRNTVNTYPPQIIGYRTVNVPYTEGTLIITMTDRRTNRLVWRGWGVGTVTNTQTYEGDLHQDIQSIMKRYPIPLLTTK